MGFDCRKGLYPLSHLSSPVSVLFLRYRELNPGSPTFSLSYSLSLLLGHDPSCSASGVAGILQHTASSPGQSRRQGVGREGKGGAKTRAWLLIGLVVASSSHRFINPGPSSHPTEKGGSWHLLPAQPASPGQPEQLGTQGTASKAIPDHRDACHDPQRPAGLL